LKTCKEMFDETVRSLRYSDTAKLETDIYEKDRQINKYQQEIRRMMMTHLAVSPQTEIHPALVMISIVIDVERLGDYAKNIEELAKAHPKRLHAGSYEEIVGNLEDEVKSKFESVTSAFRIYDIEAAKEVMDEHRSITRQCDKLVTSLVGKVISEIPANDQVALALYLRYLKRISSHLTNIVSSIVNPFDMIGYKGKNSKGSA